MPLIFSRRAASRRWRQWRRRPARDEETKQYAPASQRGCPGFPLFDVFKHFTLLTVFLSHFRGFRSDEVDSDSDVDDEEDREQLPSDGTATSTITSTPPTVQENDHEAGFLETDFFETDEDDEEGREIGETSTPLMPDYDVEGVVGFGSFGFVVAGRKTRGAGAGDQLVAVKIFEKEDVLADRGGVQRMKAEKEALQTINCPFVLKLLETWQDGNHVFFATKLMIGGDLHGRLEASPDKRLPASHVRFYAANLVEAVSSIHSMGFAHRDLKPENILIDERGYLRVADLGVSKRFQGRTLTYVGTPLYMAPEVLVGSGHDHAVDIWALGVMVFEMAAGCTPFQPDKPCRFTFNVEGIIRTNILASRSTPLNFSDDFDRVTGGAGCRDVIAKALTFDSEERVQNVGGGIAALRNHPWFLEIDWEGLRAKRLPAPWTPDGSSCSFEEEDLWHGQDLSEPYTGDQTIFEGF